MYYLIAQGYETNLTVDVYDTLAEASEIKTKARALLDVIGSHLKYVDENALPPELITALYEGLEEIANWSDNCEPVYLGYRSWLTHQSSHGLQIPID